MEATKHGLLAIKKLWGICLAVPAILGNMGCPSSFNSDPSDKLENPVVQLLAVWVITVRFGVKSSDVSLDVMPISSLQAISPEGIHIKLGIGFLRGLGLFACTIVLKIS